MIQTIEIDLPVAADVVESHISDLCTYPQWMGLVHSVSGPDELGGYRVELRGKIGPFARSKVLRMVRVPDAEHVRFERRELNGRDHGRWVLLAKVRSSATGEEVLTHLSITLNYEGRLWSSVVERVLIEEIEQSKSRLREMLLRSA